MRPAWARRALGSLAECLHNVDPTASFRASCSGVGAAAPATAAASSTSALASLRASAAFFVGAGALATALLGGAAAMCEEAASDNEEITAAITQLWHQIDEALHRLEAALPGGRTLGPIPKPRVSFSAAGDVEVVFELPQELDIPGRLWTACRFDAARGTLQSPRRPASCVLQERCGRCAACCAAPAPARASRAAR